jgi:hypothetical protein
MNYQQTLELLRKYQVANPVKYKQKYGDVMPEIAAEKVMGMPSAPAGILGVKIEVKSKEEPKAVEMQFTEPAPIVAVNTTAPVPEKPKRGRKPKNG